MNVPKMEGEIRKLVSKSPQEAPFVPLFPRSDKIRGAEFSRIRIAAKHSTRAEGVINPGTN